MTAKPSPSSSRESAEAPFLRVLAGVMIFLIYQYALALWRLSHGSGSGGMDNKFSALAKSEYWSFLLLQNLKMCLAYAILGFLGTLLVQPLIHYISRKTKLNGALPIFFYSLIAAALLHGYFMLRLVETRPYFLHDAIFGGWYYHLLDIIPLAIKPACLLFLFKILPLLAGAFAVYWQMKRHRFIAITGTILAAAIGIIFGFRAIATNKNGAVETSGSPNILIIGSDSLRSDKLGIAGYRPARHDGMAADGVSPIIDSLARDSINFQRCYTSIASTLESGTSLMSSEYPQTHGLRQMYPDRDTLDRAKKQILPIATLMRGHGYDTAAIGDWCAGYYNVMPLGFEHISVSSFDNFKIYMSQAVVMAHFVVPLYFDNAVGYKIFPELGAFADFVTPEVVTQRVEQRLQENAATHQPFFWHVFYSCTHLPYRSPEPYCSMFTDPSYQGKNKNAVDFDIDSFIGGTDLESKWKALGPKDIAQIRGLYDGCTREFDDCVGHILDALKKNGLDRNTIVIITADHGDDQYEPGVTLGHGQTFNGGLQANDVPMIVHVPGIGPREIPETVRLIDVAPTIADLAGIEKPTQWQGKSFAGWIKGTEPPEWRPFYGETGFPFVQFRVPGVERPKLPPMDELTQIQPGFNYQFVVKPEYAARIVDAKQRCLRTRYWKLVCTPTSQGTRHFSLFHLPDDPNAGHDLADDRGEILVQLETALDRWMDRNEESSIQDIFPEGEPL